MGQPIYDGHRQSDLDYCLITIYKTKLLLTEHNMATTIDTIFGEKLLTYTLQYAENGIECDGEDYVELDDARDIAFEVSSITLRSVHIYEHFGASSNLIETVTA